jgi:hypothetical protein
LTGSRLGISSAASAAPSGDGVQLKAARLLRPPFADGSGRSLLARHEVSQWPHWVSLSAPERRQWSSRLPPFRVSSAWELYVMREV